MNQAELKNVIRRVQLSLMVKGYDPGPMDGAIGQKTREALKKFQGERNLKQTGLVDAQTLDALGITR